MNADSPPLTLTQGRLCVALAAVLWSTSGAYTKLLTNVMPEHGQPEIESPQISRRVDLLEQHGIHAICRPGHGGTHDASGFC